MNFSVTEFFPGMGTLCAAFTSGLSRHGSVSVAGAAEIDGRYLRLFSDQHPEASTYLGSVTQYAPEEVSTPRSGLRCFLGGIPCSGASLAGRAKNAISSAEMHSSVGHLFLPTLHYIARHLPDLFVAENVPQYASTFSAKLIREYLTRLGYKLT